MHTTPDHSLHKITTGKYPGTMSYAEYRMLIKKLLAEDKVTGHHQSEKYLHYTKINEHRMNRLEKQPPVVDELSSLVSNLTESYTWLVISEGWCGDSAQIVPIIFRISQLSSNINLQLLLRDDHPEIMNQFLTHGKKAIPILVCLNENGHVIFQWGPRPKGAADLRSRLVHSEDPAYTSLQVNEQLHLWYARDKSASTQAEILELVRKMK